MDVFFAFLSLLSTDEAPAHVNSAAKAKYSRKPLTAAEFKSTVLDRRLVPCHIIVKGERCVGVGGPSYEVFSARGVVWNVSDDGSYNTLYTMSEAGICTKYAPKEIERCRKLYRVDENIFEWRTPDGAVLRRVTFDPLTRP
jgi:hypothetical protein